MWDMKGKKRVFVIGEINKMSVKSLYAYDVDNRVSGFWTFSEISNSL